MTAAEAEARLKIMLAWGDDPVLLQAEITDLLTMSRVVDEDGFPPSSASWGGAWDLRYGAAEGWRWKAGKCAGRFDFSSDVSDFSRSQIQKQCLELADRYAKGWQGTLIVTAAGGLDPVIGNLDAAP